MGKREIKVSKDRKRSIPISHWWVNMSETKTNYSEKAEALILYWIGIFQLWKTDGKQYQIGNELICSIRVSKQLKVSTEPSTHQMQELFIKVHSSPVDSCKHFRSTLLVSYYCYGNLNLHSPFNFILGL